MGQNMEIRSGSGFRIPLNFVLFVIAFGFGHLLHQQILPFNHQSFPYPRLNEQDSNCVCENERSKFEKMLQKLSNNKSVYPKSLQLDQVINLKNVDIQREPVWINDALNQKQIFMSIFSLSATYNFDVRQNLRMEIDKFKERFAPKISGSIHLTFLLGETKDEKVQKRIERESELFGDILQISIEDSYYNLSYKTLGAYQWIHTKLPNVDDVDWIVKTDDDIIVDWVTFTERLLKSDVLTPENRHVGKIGIAVRNKQFDDKLFCHMVLQNRLPMRRLNFKLYVPYSEWPHTEPYPPYCNGWVYAMKPKVAKQLYVAARQTPFNHIDDLYVTGIIRHRLNIGLVQLSRIPGWFSTRLLSCTLFNTVWVDWFETLAQPREDNPLIITIIQRAIEFVLLNAHL